MALAQSSLSKWTLCTRDLELIETMVEQADEQSIMTVDEFGISHAHAISSLFFAYPTTTAYTPPDLLINEDINLHDEATEPTYFITLTDGQIVSGVLQESADDDQIRYSIYAGLTRRSTGSIPLERILLITNQPAHRLSHNDVDKDSIITKNKDILFGFVESIGPTTSITTDRSMLNLVLDQIQSIQLANLPEHAQGIYITTNDNLHLRVTAYDFDLRHPLTVQIDPESLGLNADARKAWLLEPDAPIGIRVVHSHSKVVSLASITPQLVEPTGDRNWTPSPTVLANDSTPVLSSIDLHAPVRVIYPLPKGSTRIAFDLTAAVNTWTDCIASVYSISYAGNRTQILNQRLNADNPSASLNTPLDSDIETVEIRIDPGEFGPIQDRVIIEHPRVLIEF